MKKSMKKTGVSITFLAPGFLIYTIFVVIPIIYSIYLSFTSWNGIGIKTPAGLANFKAIFKNADFLLSLKNSLLVTGLSLIIQVPLGLIVAYLLFRTKVLFKAYRAVYFLPVVIASTAVATMFSILLNSDIGVFNSILKAFGLGAFQKSWLSDSKVVIYTVIAVQIWQFVGTYVIIFLASLQSIDDEIFESATIDGANSIQIFFRIACPLLKGIYSIAIIFCFTGSMKSFDIPYIMTGGGPGYASSYLGNYMYKQVFSLRDFGGGSAVTIVILAISLCFTLIFNKFSSEKPVRKG